MRDVCFANGLQLTSDEKTIIVSECIYYRVNWIDVNSGEKKHVLHLPGMIALDFCQLNPFVSPALKVAFIQKIAAHVRQKFRFIFQAMLSVTAV